MHLETKVRTLHTANHVVVLCVGALAVGKRGRRGESTQWEIGTYEIITNAWYSFTALRLMRPSSPCCIPRRKRTIATLGDGCGVTTH